MTMRAAPVENNLRPGQPSSLLCPAGLRARDGASWPSAAGAGRMPERAVCRSGSTSEGTPSRVTASHHLSPTSGRSQMVNVSSSAAGAAGVLIVRVPIWPRPRSSSKLIIAAAFMALGLAGLVGCQPSDAGEGIGPGSVLPTTTPASMSRPSEPRLPTVRGIPRITAPGTPDTIASPGSGAATGAAQGAASPGSSAASPTTRRPPLKILRTPRPKASPIR